MERRTRESERDAQSSHSCLTPKPLCSAPTALAPSLPSPRLVFDYYCIFYAISSHLVVLSFHSFLFVCSASRARSSFSSHFEAVRDRFARSRERLSPLPCSSSSQTLDSSTHTLKRSRIGTQIDAAMQLRATHSSKSRTATVCNRTRIERAPGPRSERAKRSATQRFA